MTEREFQKSIIEYFNKTLPFGALVHHSSNESTRRRGKQALGTRSGWPDLEIFYDETVLFIELKVDDNDLQENQKIVHVELKSNGFNVVTCWTLDEVKAALYDAGILK